MEKQPEIPAVLTKENFWNELMEKYPNEMKLFCAWIDEYKKRVNWNNLFTTMHEPPSGKSALPYIYKFRDIPVAMQVGIFFQYVTESKCNCGSYWGDFHGMNGFIEAMRLWFDTHNNFVSR